MRLLIDLDTGEPAIALDGKLQTTNTNRNFEQYLDVMFNTPAGSEQIFRNWGFPHEKIMSISHLQNWEKLVEYLVVSSLQQEPLIKNINSLEIDRDGNQLSLKIGVKGVNGETAETEVIVNE